MDGAHNIHPELPFPTGNHHQLWHRTEAAKTQKRVMSRRRLRPTRGL